MISKDSDFFIHNTPGYINIDSLEFPEIFNNRNFNASIKYKMYTRRMILNHFHLTDDTLPIFATLCGNDYLKIDNYPRLKDYFKYYSRYHRSRFNTNSISYFIFKNIINLILDMEDSVSSYRRNSTPYEDGITPLQRSIIDMICTNRPSEDDSRLNNEFKSILIKSVKQYHTTTNGNFNNNENYDLSLRPKINALSPDILESYNSGNFYYRLLNGNLY